jgi:outer membrane protein TolC
MRFSLLFIFCLVFGNLQAQDTVTIAVLSDSDFGNLSDFEQSVRREVDQLLGSNYTVEYRVHDQVSSFQDMEDVYESFITDPQVDFILSTGLVGSSILLRQQAYPKPCHASFIIDDELMGAPVITDNTTGIHNFSFTRIATDPERDIETLNSIYDFENLGIVVSLSDLGTAYEDVFTRYFDELMSAFGKEYTFIPLEEFEQNLDASDADAVYFTVFGGRTASEIRSLIEQVNEKGLPTFALFGRETVELGALAGITPITSLDVQARRIAINILKAAEGEDPANFPVSIGPIKSDFVVNMITAERIGIYPPYDMLRQASLLNLTEQFTDKVYTLQGVIIDALKENLDIQSADFNRILADKDVSAAVARYFPQAGISLTGTGVDKKISDNPQAFTAPFNLTADAAITQTILSTDAISNIVISKLVRELEDHEFRQVELDIVFEATQAFLNILLAKSQVRIQNENVSVTRSNLDISENKVSVGYSGEADRLRWESQYALNKIDLVDAVSLLTSARFSLNRYLNNEINEPFRAAEVNISDNTLMITDPDIVFWLEDPVTLRKFTDFLVEEGKRNLPELRQIESAIAIQESSIKWLKASFGTPDISGSFGLQHSFYNSGVNSDLLTYDRPYWSSGFKMSLPISTGGQKIIEKQRLEVGAEQLNLDYQNAGDQLELFIRANMQEVTASFNRLTLSAEAADASRKSLEIAQDSYAKGVTNITTLIDVQNSTLQSEQLAAASLYQFYLDFLSVERSIGFFYSIATESEKSEFKARLSNFMLSE